MGMYEEDDLESTTERTIESGGAAVEGEVESGYNYRSLKLTNS